MISAIENMEEKSFIPMLTYADEVHKMSGKNSRGPFYYKTVDMLKNRDNPPYFIFASPNVPNPEVYLRLLTDISEHKDKKLRTTFSPETQVLGVRTFF